MANNKKDDKKGKWIGAGISFLLIFWGLIDDGAVGGFLLAMIAIGVVIWVFVKSKGPKSTTRVNGRPAQEEVRDIHAEKVPTPAQANARNAREEMKRYAERNLGDATERLKNREERRQQRQEMKAGKRSGKKKETVFDTLEIEAPDRSGDHGIILNGKPYRKGIDM